MHSPLSHTAGVLASKWLCHHRSHCSATKHSSNTQHVHTSATVCSTNKPHCHAQAPTHLFVSTNRLRHHKSLRHMGHVSRYISQCCPTAHRQPQHETGQQHSSSPRLPCLCAVECHWLSQALSHAQQPVTTFSTQEAHTKNDQLVKHRECAVNTQSTKGNRPPPHKMH